jgi:hypothetical protein
MASGLCNTLILWVKMRADNNHPHQLFAYVDVVIKIHYPHMRMMIAVFKYVNVINNRTRIAFIYNIYFIYLIKFTQKNSF